MRRDLGWSAWGPRQTRRTRGGAPLGGGQLKVSTTDDRQKARNLQRDPRLSIPIVDPANPLRYVEVRGRAEISADPTNSVRDAIARKHGFDDGSAFDSPGSQRITATVVAERVIGQ